MNKLIAIIFLLGIINTTYAGSEKLVSYAKLSGSLSYWATDCIDRGLAGSQGDEYLFIPLLSHAYDGVGLSETYQDAIQHVGKNKNKGVYISFDPKSNRWVQANRQPTASECPVILDSIINTTAALISVMEKEKQKRKHKD